MIDGFLIVITVALLIALLFCVVIFDALYSWIEAGRYRRTEREIEAWWRNQN